MLLEGLQLSRYHLQSLLGSGGMGEVYLAEDTHIHRQVAIKIVQTEAQPYPNSEASKGATRLFQREVRAIAMLDHPHILPLFDYGEELVKGITLTYLVMPFRKEGSFADWLRQRKGPDFLSPQDVAFYLRQAASALQYAHRQHIIHQDVKPSNFLARSNEEDLDHPDLHLADFGIAKFTTATSSVSQTSRGTPTYMAPEQWSGQPVPATDQYALAIMAYQLLTGNPPFQGRQEQIMYHHFSTQPQPPSALNPRIPSDIDSVLLHALEKKPEQRFASISAFARAFQQAAQVMDAPMTISSVSPRKAQGEDIYAVLAISTAEAEAGTTRTLTLPDGQRVPVVVPAGTQAGQIIRLEKQSASPNNLGHKDSVILTIAILPGEERALTIDSASLEKTTFSPKSTASDSLQPSGKKKSIFSPATTRWSTFFPTASQSNSTVTAQRPRLSRHRVILLISLIILIVLLTGSGIFYFTRFNYLQRLSLLNAAIPNPYTSSGTLALNDPLSDNSNGYFWGEGGGTAGTCAFTGGAYDVSISVAGLHYCTAGNTDFSNFAYQVQMTIVQGDQGGIIFRADDTSGNFYYFHISRDGFYALDLYTGNRNNRYLTSGADPTDSNSNPIINTGLNQSNLIAVVANGSTIDLYVNHQKIDSVPDSTYSHGVIGVAADEYTNSTRVVFSNARVWTF